MTFKSYHKVSYLLVLGLLLAMLAIPVMGEVVNSQNVASDAPNFTQNWEADAAPAAIIACTTDPGGSGGGCGGG